MKHTLTLGRGYEQLGTLDALHQLSGGKNQLGHLGARRRRLQGGRGRGSGRRQDIGQRGGAQGVVRGAAAAGIIRLLLLLGGAGAGVGGRSARAIAGTAALGGLALAAIVGGRGGCHRWSGGCYGFTAHAEVQRRIEHRGG